MENNSNSADSAEGNTEDSLRRNSCNDLGEGNILGTSPADAIASAAEDPDEDGCVLIHHMDIKEPLINMKKALEESHSICLDGYDFYLQDTTLDIPVFECSCHCTPIPDFFPLQLAIIPCNHILLAGHKNLVEQCVQGSGTVQINLQLKIETDGTRKINIVDVLKPSDSYLLATGQPAFSPGNPQDRDFGDPDMNIYSDTSSSQIKSESLQLEEEPHDKNMIRWVVDQNFRASQQRLQIPQDPTHWDPPHVRHWLLWAVRKFNLTGINICDWNITGAKLCSFTLEDFKERVPNDEKDIFWTHIELLRRCKFVAVMQNPEHLLLAKEDEQKMKEMEYQKNIMKNREKRKLNDPEGRKVVLMEQSAISTNSNMAWGSRSGNNGQVQLWQFLLDLLTDKNHRNCIQWLGAEGEFKLFNPERVAQLWGMRKNKPNMNYEKLSRALRYYYDGDMISKVSGKRFVYKFVCDLKQLLGYSAFELNRLVIEAEMRAVNTRLNDPLEHTIFGTR